MNTQVWFNRTNGHHFAVGPRGMELNGQAAISVPVWARKRAPDAVYGPVHEWNGGECPIDPNMEIRALFRGRNPYFGPAIWPQLRPQDQVTMWHHAPSGRRFDPAADIVAYQVRLA